MAKRSRSTDQHSGDDDTEEVSSPENPGSESESESEPEPEQTPKHPPVIAPKKPQPQDSSSASSSGSGSDPDTQKPNNPTVKPISSKPMNPTPTKKPSRSKPKPTSPTKPVVVAVAGGRAKRQAAEDDGGAKKSKKTKKIETLVEKPTPTDDVKRQLFQRLWSEDDEIAILKGMIDYRAKKRSDPVSDLNAFHEFIKKSLHVDVSKTQLQDKIRRLKKKYENNAGKEKKGKKERTFSKPHEQKAYDLSKKIWGKEKNDNVDRVVESNGIVKEEVSKTSGKDNGVKEEGEKSVDVVMRNENGGSKILSLASFRRNVDVIEKWLEENSWLLSVEKRNEMKKKLKPLRVVEADLCVKRANLMQEQTNLVIEAMKASRN